LPQLANVIVLLILLAGYNLSEDTMLVHELDTMLYTSAYVRGMGLFSDGAANPFAATSVNYKNEGIGGKLNIVFQ
jgi:hypothetical protein